MTSVVKGDDLAEAHAAEEDTPPRPANPWGDVMLSDACSTPLHSSWSLWYTRKEATQHQKNGLDYEALIKQLGTFSTVEHFWALYSRCIRPSDMISGTDYHLFRKGIKPMWEDAHNREGGKLSVRIRKKFSNQLWEDLILALLGEQLSNKATTICGGVIGIRYQEDVLSVWNRTTALPDRQILGESLRGVLHLPENTPLDYKEHDRSLIRLYRPPQQRGDRGDSAVNAKEPTEGHPTNVHPHRAQKDGANQIGPGVSSRARNTWWNTRVEGDGHSSGPRPNYATGGRSSFESSGGDWSVVRSGGSGKADSGGMAKRNNFGTTTPRLSLLPLPPDGGRQTEATVSADANGASSSTVGGKHNGREWRKDWGGAIGTTDSNSGGGTSNASKPNLGVSGVTAANNVAVGDDSSSFGGWGSTGGGNAWKNRNSAGLFGSHPASDQVKRSPGFGGFPSDGGSGLSNSAGARMCSDLNSKTTDKNGGTAWNKASEGSADVEQIGDKPRGSWASRVTQPTVTKSSGRQHRFQVK